MRGMTQQQRVLRALRAAGGRGISAVDFLAPDVCDGGAPIVRLPSRIEELRRAGHPILSRGRRHGCVVYVLRAESRTPPPPPDPPARSLDAVANAYDPFGDWV